MRGEDLKLIAPPPREQHHTAQGLPWRDQYQRHKDGIAEDERRALDHEERMHFLAELHEARLKLATGKVPGLDGHSPQYWALYGATVALHYLEDTTCYNDQTIFNWLHAEIKLEPPICGSCERPMEKSGEFCAGRYEWRCAECGKRGTKIMGGDALIP
jgi:hypothetical protein